MATLTQDLNSFKTYLVWYGNCEEETCEEFDLDQHKDLIEICYEWTLSVIQENGKVDLLRLLKIYFFEVWSRIFYYIENRTMK